MKSLGVIRKVDSLGRIVLPRELTKFMNIKLAEKGGSAGDPLEIFTDGDTIILKKYEPGCKLCGESKNIVDVDGVKICKECVKKIYEGVVVNGK